MVVKVPGRLQLRRTLRWWACVEMTGQLRPAVVIHAQIERRGAQRLGQVPGDGDHEIVQCGE
jgi:hypothetical protein